MKKLILILILISFNAGAEGTMKFPYITRIIGAECGRILHDMKEHDYPTKYDHIKPRNSQFWALKKCLDIYKENGGNLEELSSSFQGAEVIYNREQDECRKLKDVEKKEVCLSASEGRFSMNLAIDSDLQPILSVFLYDEKNEKFYVKPLKDILDKKDY